MSEKSYDDMTLEELQEEFDAAIYMVNLGSQDPGWLPIIKELDARITAMGGQAF